MTCLYIL